MSLISQDFGDLVDITTQSMLAPIFLTFTATKAVINGGLFIVDNVLYKATADIAVNSQIVIGTNAELASTVAEELNKTPSVTWKVLATADASKTFAQQLTTLKAKWDTLTIAQKNMTRIRRSTSQIFVFSDGYLFSCVTYSGGDYKLFIRLLDISNCRCYTVNGTTTYSDVSSSINTSALYLEMLICG